MGFYLFHYIFIHNNSNYTFPSQHLYLFFFFFSETGKYIKNWHPPNKKLDGAERKTKHKRYEKQVTEDNIWILSHIIVDRQQDPCRIRSCQSNNTTFDLDPIYKTRSPACIHFSLHFLCHSLEFYYL